MRLPLIYVAYCRTSGKCYVGQTDDFWGGEPSKAGKTKGRKETHIRDARHGKKTAPKFYNALRIHSPEQFIWGIVEYCGGLTRGQLTDRENFWVSRLNSIDDGYNCATAVCYPGKIIRRPLTQEQKDRISKSKQNPSAETRKKLSAAKIGNTNNLGKKWSQEARDRASITRKKLKLPGYWLGKKRSAEDRLKMSLYNKGRKLSKEHKLKISEGTRRAFKEGRRVVNPNFTHQGRPHSEETKLRLSELNKGKHLSAETKLKLSLIRKGKKHGPMSPEHRRKLSEVKLGKPTPWVFGNKHCLGRTVSAETRAKISKSHMGHKMSDETKLKISMSNKGKTRHHGIGTT